MPIDAAHELNEVIDAPHANDGVFTVAYGTSSVSNGNTLTPTVVKAPPTITVAAADPAKFYTVVMTDPDAPSRAEPSFREWVHYVVANVPGEAIRGGSLEGGDVLAAYVGAGPPEGTGLHRYVFLVFATDAKVDVSGEPQLKNDSTDGRGKWNVRAFAQRLSLGAPIAVDLFQAEYDDYVPILYKSLGA
jgi:hypothetical protein